MAFNPFDITPTEIHRLTESKLQVLLKDSVTEGYWVEYKSKFIENEKLAKSIAALANTYGGWFFIGVEADKKGNVAVAITGFSLDDVPNPIDRLREVIKSSIDPVPLFYSTLVPLATGLVVLAAFVPDDQETPFIHKDGRIYRRTADSSEPVAESNRYAVDRLVDRGRRVRKEFRRFARDERIFSRGERNNPWLKIFISPVPLIEQYAKGIPANDYHEPSSSELSRLRDMSHHPIEVPGIDGALFATSNAPYLQPSALQNRSFCVKIVSILLQAMHSRLNCVGMVVRSYSFQFQLCGFSWTIR